MKRVSVIIPGRNEEKYISDCLESVIRNDYPAEKTEIFFIDGDSTDNTVDIVKTFTKKHAHVKLLHNAEKIVPYALNKGIKESSGEVIIRMDAHSVYPKNYISALVNALYEYDADNAGGIWITLPADDTPVARSIAYASSSVFGVGDALYRTKTNLSKVVKTDTVPYGCYRKEVFDRIGLFDTELVRNQDDEFNARLIQSGGNIILVPSVKIKYYARESYSKMSKMFYQYGLFKPLVNKKLRKPATIRQFVPFLFVLYLFSLLFAPLLPGLFFKISLLPLMLYIFSIFSVSIITAFKKKDAAALLFLPPAFFLIHFSYGFGYIYGLIKFIIFGKRFKQLNISR